MPLTFLDVRNVRILEHTSLEPGPSLNVICGANGSGKTSLLEGIHLLGIGRSFRHNQAKEIIRRGSSELTVLGRYRALGGTDITAAILRRKKGYEIKINGSPETKVANLAKVFPLQCITPDSHYEFLHSSKQRRALLDWSLFHVEQTFYPTWLQSRRLIQQRAACLKNQRLWTSLVAWDQQLATVGEVLQAYRQTYVAKWNTVLQGYGFLLGSQQQAITIELHRGWKEGANLEQALKSDRTRDQLRAVTHSGPHRADLKVYYGNENVADFASHGQQKLIVIALRLAQMELFYQETGRKPVLLLDDVPAELDHQHRTRLMEKLARLQLQIFATTTHANEIPTQFWPDCQVFHVEQGKLRRVETVS